METRKPNRLTAYDYSRPGAYFVTICTKDKSRILWNKDTAPPVGATCGRPQTTERLSPWGVIVHTEIGKIESIYNGVVRVDKFVVMPNHIHMIIVIDTFGRPKVAPTISRVIQQLKGSVSKQIGHAIWQKSFHDHIIRAEDDYLRIWEYTDTNPATRETDCFYTEE